ncbi:ATP-grasp domain-containing protein [Achromobacter xylosoxidans]|jgi:predicted ATP-grasp superfamily ATP-dependent carboligase|uniref:ATP-grasp domain-containing protein n=1 Tax=Alcaligenes xylosoxydans xylosoxydans TaxID=85698 RepID=UPI0001F4222F|nr:ATP-grasp domain-containing protein [Achromobacter xylosoxidans]EFV82376.1 biotin carboxylase [Achromobacter xylosoxidans C54]KOQ22361.1 carboxylate--amine ligase [Achromobacter xylosoxidans]KOQ22717.1 carboxylate--amine ligase [Achromobacter xylosoxidans]KOQ31324.1 carboxylate--amine ligase [Achromobacter xylosoxidans]KOQ42511.1 carboxylate--amine ligase [Achromobacter xylosoxidans]
MKEAVLLLMHQGNSFTAELHERLAARGIALVAISSRPADMAVLERNQPLLDAWVVGAGPELSDADVRAGVAQLAQRGYRFLAAIATFEGYRLFMADLNHAFGAPDVPRVALERALHKHRCREFLLMQGLSAATCRLIPAGSGADAAGLDPQRKWFIKPVRGAASFGCFILENRDDLTDVPAMQAQMVKDGKLAAIFMGRYDFFAEEYIEGPEFSYEIVAAAGRPRVICVHEKARVERLPRTTLESMSISPPISLPADTLREGERFVAECLTRMGLGEGAYHVEMKYWEARRRWEIIEINPRMGGSLINASTARATGASILDLWLRTLLARAPDDIAAFHAQADAVAQLDRLDRDDDRRAVVFISKYGKKGATVDSIDYDTSGHSPDLLEFHVKPGTRLEDSDRAICVMDALWQVDRAALADAVDSIDRESDENFRITYQAAQGV